MPLSVIVGSTSVSVSEYKSLPPGVTVIVSPEHGRDVEIRISDARGDRTEQLCLGTIGELLDRYKQDLAQAEADAAQAQAAADAMRTRNV